MNPEKNLAHTGPAEPAVNCGFLLALLAVREHSLFFICSGINEYADS